MWAARQREGPLSAFCPHRSPALACPLCLPVGCPFVQGFNKPFLSTPTWWPLCGALGHPGISSECLSSGWGRVLPWSLSPGSLWPQLDVVTAWPTVRCPGRLSRPLRHSSQSPHHLLEAFPTPRRRHAAPPACCPAYTLSQQHSLHLALCPPTSRRSHHVATHASCWAHE